MSEGKRKDSALVRPYVADGIKEYDNPMPRWWVGLLYATIVYAVVYLVYYHLMGGPSLEQTLAQEKAASASEGRSSGDTGGASGASGNSGGGAAQPTPSLSERLKDAGQIAAGKTIFLTYCLPCHGANGEGNIGPNLTDDYWIHGGKDEDIIKTITAGVPEKGMVAWGPVIGAQKVEQVASYVISLHGTNPPNAKAPQGDLYKRP